MVAFDLVPQLHEVILKFGLIQFKYLLNFFEMEAKWLNWKLSTKPTGQSFMPTGVPTP